MSNTNEMRLINVIVTMNFSIEGDKRTAETFVCSEVFTNNVNAREWIFNYMDRSNAVLDKATNTRQYWCSREYASRYVEKQNCYFVTIEDKKLDPKVLTIAQSLEHEI